MGRMNVILAGVAENRIYAPAADGSNPTGLIFPQNYVEFACDGDHVTWSINVRGATGAPTSWRLEARFLDVVEHTFGPQYSEPQLVPFTEAQTTSFVTEGMGWSKPGATALIPNPNYLPVLEVSNPDYDPAQFVPNPAYDPATDPRGFLLNPGYDPRPVIPNPVYDPREFVWNPAVPRSAGEFGLVADSGDELGGNGGKTATVTRTVQLFNRRHKIELRPIFEGGTNPGLVVALTAQVTGGN